MIDTMLSSKSLQGLALAQLLSLALLAACVWWVYHDLQFVVGTSNISLSDAWHQGRESELPMRIAGFALAVIAVHAALGLVVWGLARLTVAALPGRSTPRPILPWTAAWSLLFAALVLAANSAWFPASRFAGGISWLATNRQGTTPVGALLAVTAGMILLVVWMAAWRRAALLRRQSGRLATLAAFAGVPALLSMLPTAVPPAAIVPDRPHVVIIGVDSLRQDMSEASPGRTLTPNIDGFLSGAHRFSDAVSPLARTYPAWVSILTGRHPVTSNARFNLMPRAQVREGDSLGDALRLHGYHTIYATDEVRFANFDESFGFDQLITPPVGASDFLLGTLGDLPLVNVLSGTLLGRILFPGIHGNRAAFVTYQPAHFVARLERELQLKGPGFMAIHLTLSHWPYSWAGQAMPTTPQQYRPGYRRAIEAVDGQFLEVMRVLERKGVLENAIVVVLSDHGEALGFPSDTMLRTTGTSREIWDSLWGHGTSVLSPHQYAVLLAMRAYGRAGLPGPAADYDWPVALEDVRPTLEEFATGAAPGAMDGISLIPFLAGRKSATDLNGRIRFTETCFNTAMMMAGELDVSGLVSEAAMFYQVAPDTGWVQLRPDRLAEIMAKKQRAALSRESLLAAIPSWTDGSVSFLYASRRDPLPRRLESRPNPASDPEAARLWDALHARFPGELPDLPGSH